MAKRRKTPKIRIKNAQEIESMRTAGRTASEVLQRVAKAVAPGVTTGELDELVRDMIHQRGCKSAFHGYRGFPGQACLSVNEEIVHGIGGARKLQFGDLIKIDVGIVQDGWIGDNATSVAVGDVDQATKRLMIATEQALYDGIDRARAGNRLAEVCGAVEDRVNPLGFTIVREFVGHGVGRELHEEPQVPNYRPKGKTPVLEPGMILAIEPMVNAGSAAIRILDDKWTVITADRKMSAHFEHTVLVTDGEPELLTWRPREATPELLGLGST